MSYAIVNSSGNVLEWFGSEADARAALLEIRAEHPDSDLDLLTLDAGERPQRVTPAARSAWPAVRLVWSHAHGYAATQTLGHIDIATTIRSVDVPPSGANATDERVPASIEQRTERVTG
jgi:hypothetical protein